MAGCSCGGDREPRLLYACSGMASTGMIADQVWRKLPRDGVGAGTCLAAIADRIAEHLAAPVRA